MNRLAVAIMVLSLACGGCGYSFDSAYMSTPGGIKRLHVPVIENTTTYTDLTYTLTNELVHQFNQSRVVRITDPELADGILQVRIKSVEIISAARDKTGEASASRRAIIRAEAVLKRLKDDAIIWQGGTFEGRRTYQVSDEQSYVEANLHRALREIAVDVAEKIHYNVLEDF